MKGKGEGRGGEGRGGEGGREGGGREGGGKGGRGEGRGVHGGTSIIKTTLHRAKGKKYLPSVLCILPAAFIFFRCASSACTYVYTVHACT